MQVVFVMKICYTNNKQKNDKGNFFKMKEFVITENDSGQRIDKFILKTFPALSKGVMCKAVRTKNVKLNGKRCEISTHLSTGDNLKIFIKDELLGVQKSEQKADFMNADDIMERDIVYEDENIILINKKPGIIVHSDDKNSGNTLVDMVKKYLFKRNEYNPLEENSFAPSICNRLDRNTAGIVIAAKNAKALREINRKIQENEITKKYLCLCANKPPKDEETITAYHRKESSSNTVTLRKTAAEGYKQIITRYKVVEKTDNAFLVEVQLVTGRTHQIRAHMAFIGSVIIGDKKYGDKNINKKYNYKHQTLCAYKISFDLSPADSYLKYLDNKEFSVNDVWFIR